MDLMDSGGNGTSGGLGAPPEERGMLFAARFPHPQQGQFAGAANL